MKLRIYKAKISVINWTIIVSANGVWSSSTLLYTDKDASTDKIKKKYNKVNTNLHFYFIIQGVARMVTKKLKHILFSMELIGTIWSRSHQALEKISKRLVFLLGYILKYRNDENTKFWLL